MRQSTWLSPQDLVYRSNLWSPGKSSLSPMGESGKASSSACRAVGRRRDGGWPQHIFVQSKWTHTLRQLPFENLSHSQWGRWKPLLPCLLGWLQYGQTLKHNAVLNFVLNVVVQYWTIKEGAGTVLFKYLLLGIPLPFPTYKVWSYLLIFPVWKDPLSILSGCPIFHCVMGCILKMNSPKQLGYIAITVLFFWRNSPLGICTLIRLHAAMMAALLLCQTPHHYHPGTDSFVHFNDSCHSEHQGCPSWHPERVIHSWKLSSGLFPSSPVAATQSNQQTLSLFFSSFHSAHPCSWWPLEILMRLMCCSTWVLILTRTWPQEAVGSPKKSIRSSLPVNYFRDSLLCKRGVWSWWHFSCTMENF